MFLRKGVILVVQGSFCLEGSWEALMDAVFIAHRGWSPGCPWEQGEMRGHRVPCSPSNPDSQPHASRWLEAAVCRDPALSCPLNFSRGGLQTEMFSSVFGVHVLS